MKWNSQDVHMYEKSMKYVDTVVISLIPISFAEDMKQTVELGEFIQLFLHRLEQQLKGRILLLPGFTYLKIPDTKALVHLLRQWEEHLLHKDFEHIFYVTFDSDWSEIEEYLSGKFIYLSSFSFLDEIKDEHEIKSFVEEEVHQVLNIFLQKWRGI